MEQNFWRDRNLGQSIPISSLESYHFKSTQLQKAMADIDKLVKEYSDRLTYKRLLGDALTNASPEEIELDKAKANVDVGSQVFSEIEGRTDLTPQEKQQVYQGLVKAAVQDELNTTVDPATLLRGNSATSRFMTDYMNTYAKEYMDSVAKDTLKVAMKVKSQLPESVVGTEDTNPFSSSVINSNTISEGDKAKLRDICGEITKETIESSERNLPKLSPEAREFMKSALEPTAGNQKAMNTVVASTLLLRGASTSLFNGSAKLRQKDDTKDVGNLMLGANIAVQTYANFVNKPLGEQVSQGKPQDETVNNLRNEKGLGQTLSAYKAIAEGSQSIDRFVGLKRFDNRINELNDKKTQLEQNPTFGDKFKAFFQHGLKGVKGEIEKLQGKIDITTMAKDTMVQGKSLDELQKKLEGMKVDRAEFALAMESARNIVGLRRLEESMGNTPSMSDEQVNKALDTHARAKIEKEDLNPKIKEQEKIVKVREKLAPEEASHGQGHKQQQGTGTKIH
ncbi:hypothetical protein DES53_104247 [Roseimicrobium gellanilyticum]|uniref:Ras-GAP domain-containing protein n=1 Tax=Roseimicrobium gellanilyticum TaxID=748857 RepID=A0A366HMQ8_9BACT|nr:hypothetical protein [Roseimicrobium gellanilyticum]RBP44427.1 hypothetical protein DES53_104247 [Roseimicrobium gellanilyticum]